MIPPRTQRPGHVYRERDRKGPAVSKDDKFGMRLSNTAEVIFEDVEIPACNLVGTEESGFCKCHEGTDRLQAHDRGFSLGACQLPDHPVPRNGWPWKSPSAQTDDTGKLADMEMLIQASALSITPPCFLTRETM